MKKEQNVEIVNINVKDIIQKFKTIPDICIINEENIGVDIKEIFKEITGIDVGDILKEVKT